MKAMSSRAQDRSTGRVLPLLVLIISVGFSLFAWHHLNRNVRLHETARFNARVEEDVHEINEEVLLYANLVNAARGLFAASKEVEKHEWREYVEGIRLDRFYPGIRTMTYVEKLDRSRGTELEQAMRRLGIERFAVHPNTGLDTIYPAIFIEPEANAMPEEFGLDYAADSFRAHVLALAWDSGVFTGFDSDGPDEGRFVVGRVAYNAGVPG